MAKTLYSQSGKVEYGIKKYIVDTEADKEALNLRSTKMGSKCYVIDTKKWYILNSSNQWIPFVDAGGSGGSGSPFNVKGSVPTIDDLPTEDNAIGDLYIVQEDHSEWVWLTSGEESNGYWERLGTNILPETIVAVTGEMTDAQKVSTRNNIDAVSQSSFSILNTAVQELVTYNVNVSGATPTITPVANTIYKCGTLDSLTVSNPPATGAYSIVFTSGSTATTTTIPATILGLESFAAEANTLYEINVLDNRAVVGSWAVSA